MDKAKLGARILLGLIFFVFGLNGFLNFLPMPTDMPEKAQAFTGGLFQAGYFFPFLKATEVVCGLLLLSGFFVPLALVILAPVSLNIFLFHIILAPAGAPVAIAIVLLNAFLGWTYMDRYKPMLKSK
jgi:putative oxidoreductase